MKYKCIPLLVFLSVFIGTIPLNGQGFLMKKDITIEKGETEDNVISFGGEILIKGKVKESAIAFGGAIIIEGEVGDDVVGFGSKIVLKSTSRVKGDVVSFGGELQKEPGTIIEGDTARFDLSTFGDVKNFMKDGLGGALGISLIPLLLIIKLISLFFWFIFAIVMVAIFPRQISLASSQLHKKFWPIFGTGLLGIVIFIGLVIFSAILSLLLIGIPILISLVIVGFVIKIFGRVVLFYFFGEILSKAFGWKNTSPLVIIIIGFILVSLVGFIPILGSLFSFVLSIIGWGVTIRTKFGTTENWFRRSAKNSA